MLLIGCKLNFSTFGVLIKVVDSESFNSYSLGFWASEVKGLFHYYIVGIIPRLQSPGLDPTYMFAQTHVHTYTHAYVHTHTHNNRLLLQFVSGFEETTPCNETHASCNVLCRCWQPAYSGNQVLGLGFRF